MIPHFKIQITQIPLGKKAPYRCNTISPHVPLHAVEELIENLGLKHPIIFDVYNLGQYYHSNNLSSFSVSMLKDMCGYFERPCKSRHLKRDLLAKVSDLVKECECTNQ